MPYIDVKSNTNIDETKEKKIKELMGMCISLIPGKSENWLMVNIAGNQNLYFKGDKKTPAVFIDFKVLGTLDKGICSKISDVLCKKMYEILSVAPSNVYICFMETQKWGWSSTML